MDLFEKYFNRALRFLSFRPRSEKEIRDFLLKKKVSQETADKIISKLNELKFINDEEFVKWWMQQRTGHKPKGINLIKMELRQKGISKELIEEIVAESGFKIEDELKNARVAVEKKIALYKKLPREQALRKLVEFLMRRGFTFDTARKVIDHVQLNERG